MTAPLLSVVICTYGRAARLKEMLSSLAACRGTSRPDWEVVMVDNLPGQEVPAAVAEFAGRLPIRSVPEPVAGLCSARNRGASAARGEVIWFLDDDLQLADSWLEAALAAASGHPEAVYFGGKITPDWGGIALPDWVILDRADPDNHAGIYGNYEFGESDRPLGPDEQVMGANMGYRRAAFIRAGGFRTDLGLAGGQRRLGEEGELLGRLRSASGQGLYVAGAAVRHLNGRESLELSRVLGWCRASGRSSSLVRIIKREREGRNTLARRMRDVLRDLSLLPFEFALAGTIGWLRSPRGRVRLWTRAMTRLGRLEGSFSARPDMSLDRPAVLREPPETRTGPNCPGRNSR